MGGSRITANGIDTYYERQGSGEPLLLLHGGFGSSHDHEAHMPALASHFEVIAPDRRAHGRTPDAGAIGYEIMVDDTLALMDALGIEKAHVVGYSDGANIGMLIGIGEPDRLRKLVLISGNYSPDGTAEEMRAYFAQSTAETAPPPMIEGYAAQSPDGREHFPVVYEKMKAMLLNEPQLTPAQLAQIQAPTLVMCADDDLVRLDHTIEIHRAISGSQLCVVPGASHLMPFEKPELMLGIVTTFLLETESPKIPMF